MLKEDKLCFYLKLIFILQPLLNQCSNMFCYFVGLIETRNVCSSIFIHLCDHVNGCTHDYDYSTRVSYTRYILEIILLLHN